MKKRIAIIVGIIISILIVGIVGIFLYNSIMQKRYKKMPFQERMDNIYEDIDHGQGDCFYVMTGDGSLLYKNCSGNFEMNSKYVNASITKMYTATILFQLVQEGKISLSDPITKFFQVEEIAGIHQYKGVDYSEQITINHLLCQTSGLPDFFTEKVESEKTFLDILFDEGDFTFSFEDAIDRTRKIEAHFIPGKGKKAYYSDLNYHLLSEIIERVTKQSLADNYQERIFEPLKLKDTLLMEEGMESVTVPIHYNNRQYVLANYIASDRGAGGIVTTLDESMIFLQAFMRGELFSIDKLEEWDTFRSIQFFPMQYGMGMMKCKLPINDHAIGHSGVTGSIAYYFPEKDIFIVGTTNDVDEAGSIQKMYQLVAGVAME